MNREMSYPFLFLSILFILVLSMFGSAFITIIGIVGLITYNNRNGKDENKNIYNIDDS